MEPSTEGASQGEGTERDVSAEGKGNLEKAKVAQARAERKEVKVQQKERKSAKIIKEAKAEDKRLREEREARDGTAIVKKIRAEHGPFPTRYAMGDQRNCGVCGGRPRFQPPQECSYCPGKIYCSELCQARDWPDHKRNCNREKGGTRSRIREAQVLKGTQQEQGKEPERPVVVRSYRTQGLCMVCHLMGGFKCNGCADVYCSDGCHEKAWELHRDSCRPSPLKEEIETGVQVEQGDVKVNVCVVGEEAETMDDGFDRWCKILGYGGVSEREEEREQMEIRMRLRDMEREREMMDQRGEEIRVFKAKAQGSCKGCDLKGELRCATCTEVYCSVECHKKKGQCPSGF